LLLLGSYGGAFVSPSLFASLSLLSYLYPFLLVINIAFCVLWIFLKFRFVIIPLAAILLQVNYVPRLFQFDSPDEVENQQENSFNLMTYNTCSFGYETKNKEERTDSVLLLILSQNAEVLVLQDFPRVSTKHIIHRKFLDAGYKYFFSLDLKDGIMDKSVIYSKFPLGQCGGLLPSAEEPDEFIYADVQANGREFRIYNLHLESYRLLNDEKSLTKEIKNFNVINDEQSRHKFKDNILQKVVKANKIRAKEAEQLSEIISKCEKPYIVAGDFNDTPFSFTYRLFSKGLTDCFVEKGKDFGITYDKVFPPFRIDYVLISKEFATLNYFSPKPNYSDHYPVFVILKLQ
jgi:endonuclease/exonuclease/phosphatase (EEP) superfamily protein YafD